MADFALVVKYYKNIYTLLVTTLGSNPFLGASISFTEFLTCVVATDLELDSIIQVPCIG